MAGCNTAFCASLLDAVVGLEARRGSSNGMPRRERMKRRAKLIKIAVDNETDAELLCSDIVDAIADDDDDENRILVYFQAWMRLAMLTA